MNMDDKEAVLDYLTGYGLSSPAISVSQWKGQEPIRSSVHGTVTLAVHAWL